MKKNNNLKQGEFGPIYTQFVGRPKEAIKYLRRVKSGECLAALYRPGIGPISIVWGEITDTRRHQGYGLAHIIDKHEAEINAMGYTIEDFIALLVQNGRILHKEQVGDDRIVCSGDGFRFVVQKAFRNKKRMFLLTAFSPKKPGKNPRP